MQTKHVVRLVWGQLGTNTLILMYYVCVHQANIVWIWIVESRGLAGFCLTSTGLYCPLSLAAHFGTGVKYSDGLTLLPDVCNSLTPCVLRVKILKNL